MKDKIPLDEETPKWFKHWHDAIFTPRTDTIDARGKRNEKWIYIIITAIIASGILANGSKEYIVGFLSGLFN